MEDRKIIRSFPSGVITPPSSKSLGHRALICAALADGESSIHNITMSEDIEATLSGIKALGAKCEMNGGSVTVLKGREQPQAVIDCAESGSTLRFLLPLAALSERSTIFTGRGRLMERPMDAYEEALTAAGCAFGRNDGRVSIRGPIKSGTYILPGNISSQFVSGFLFALPLLDGDSEIRLSTPLESKQYVDMTIDVMSRFGVEVLRPDSSRYIIKGGQRYRPARYTLEADFSQAAYFLAAGALGRDVKCSGLNMESLQGDRAILDVLRDMGAELITDGDTVSVKAEKLRAVMVDARDIPDLVPPIAALCCYCEGTSKIINAGRLRMKESDRLSAMASELRALGANISQTEDSLTIAGAAFLPGGKADAHNDHRVAMSLAVAAIRCENPVELSGWQSVNKSYPGFWLDFEGKTI